MRNLIIISLSLLFITSTAIAASYTVSGKVYNGNTQTPVGLAVVQITSVWGDSDQCSASGSTVSSNTPPVGQYSIGWTNCGQANSSCPNDDSCVGRKMTLRATKSIGGVPYAGSVTWYAGSGTESKDIRMYPTVQPRDDVVIGAAPGTTFVSPGLQNPTATLAYDIDGGTEEVTGYDTKLTFDQNKMMCDSVDFLPPFDIDFIATIDNPGGSIHVSASSPGSIPLGDPQNPLPLFLVTWNVLPFTTPDIVTVTTQEISFLDSLGGPINSIVNRTDYVIGSSESCSPYFMIDTEQQWSNALGEADVYGMEQEEWTDYMEQWEDYTEDGNSYPPTTFIPPTLYVYEGNSVGGGLDPCDAGLVMKWGDDTTPDGDYVSAYKYDHKKDPDYSNATIKVTVTAPQWNPFPPPVSQVTQVSLGLKNIPAVGGPVRSWYWNCGPGQPIPWNTPTTVTIDCSKTGVTAATPTATAYMNNPGFNIKTVQWILVDENGAWVGGTQNAPPPGGGLPGMWNYWHNLSVTPNIGGGGAGANTKWYIKYSQPPVVINEDYPPIIYGWDEISDYNGPQIMTDDWLCEDDRPVTDIHWWGSFIGWSQPDPPPIVPHTFHIGIWSDVPDDPCDPTDFSHPGRLIWENFCDNFVWNFAGFDKDPFNRPERENEACFQYTQLLSQDEWFYQEPNDPCNPDGRIYWLSIAPIYNPSDYTDPNFYPWGWKSREHIFQDDAVAIQDVVGSWPPAIGSIWNGGYPLKGPDLETWDLAFELTTNEPAYEDNPTPGDLNADKVVDFRDLAILALNWLTAVP